MNFYNYASFTVHTTICSQTSEVKFSAFMNLNAEKLTSDEIYSGIPNGRVLTEKSWTSEVCVWFLVTYSPVKSTYLLHIMLARGL